MKNQEERQEGKDAEKDTAVTNGHVNIQEGVENINFLDKVYGSQS